MCVLGKSEMRRENRSAVLTLCTTKHGAAFSIEAMALPPNR